MRRKTTTPKCWIDNPRVEARVRLAKDFARLKGFSIDKGSWIHAPSGRAVAHGWESLYLKYRPAILELLWGPEAEERNAAVAEPFRGILNAFSGGRRW